MEKKTLLTAAFLSSILLSATGVTQFANLVMANPFMYEQVPYPISPPPEAKPPSISMLNPKSNTTVISSNVSLNFTLTVTIPVMPELFYYYLFLSDIYYKASWLPNNTHLDLTEIQNSIPQRTRIYSETSLEKWGTYWTLSEYTLNPKFSINLTDIPEGPQFIEVFAVENGSRRYSQSGLMIRYGRYTLVASSIVHFDVGSIVTFSPQNKTYKASDVPLLFKAHESFTEISYSLDGQSRVIVPGNTTLTGLSNGSHNVTIYCMDETGNTDFSETIIFNVDLPEPHDPFSVATLVTASGVIIATLGIVLLVYFKKRRK